MSNYVTQEDIDVRSAVLRQAGALVEALAKDYPLPTDQPMLAFKGPAPAFTTAQQSFETALEHVVTQTIRLADWIMQEETT